MISLLIDFGNDLLMAFGTAAGLIASTIVAAGVAAANSVAQRKATEEQRRANEEAQRRIDSKTAQDNAWYRMQYYRDPLRTGAGQHMLSTIRDYNESLLERQRNRNVITGGTHESEIAGMDAMAQNYGKVMGQIRSQDDTQKAAIGTHWRSAEDTLFNKQTALDKSITEQRQQGYENFANNVNNFANVAQAAIAQSMRPVDRAETPTTPTTPEAEPHHEPAYTGGGTLPGVETPVRTDPLSHATGIELQQRSPEAQHYFNTLYQTTQTNPDIASNLQLQQRTPTAASAPIATQQLPVSSPIANMALQQREQAERRRPAWMKRSWLTRFGKEIGRQTGVELSGREARKVGLDRYYASQDDVQNGRKTIGDMIKN